MDSNSTESQNQAPISIYNLDDYSTSNPDQPVTAAQRLEFYLGLAKIVVNPGLNFVFLVLLFFLILFIINPFGFLPEKIQLDAADVLFKMTPSFFAGLVVGNKAAKS